MGTSWGAWYVCFTLIPEYYQKLILRFTILIQYSWFGPALDKTALCQKETIHSPCTFMAVTDMLPSTMLVPEGALICACSEFGVLVVDDADEHRLPSAAPCGM